MLEKLRRKGDASLSVLCNSLLRSYFRFFLLLHILVYECRITYDEDFQSFLHTGFYELKVNTFVAGSFSISEMLHFDLFQFLGCFDRSQNLGTLSFKAKIKMNEILGTRT